MSEVVPQTVAPTTTAPEAPAPVAPSAPAAPITPATPSAPHPDGTLLSATPAEGAKPAASAVPEKYELKLPDGSLLQPEYLEKIASYAKEQGFSNEQAQRLVERESQAVSGYMESQKTAFKQQSDTWVSQVQSDKEIGGEALKQNVESAKRVIQRYATPEFQKALDESGLGNHPELVRTFVRIGKAMSEDQLVLPGAQPAAKRSAAEIFYPESK
jgi:hypothetical protein